MAEAQKDEKLVKDYCRRLLSDPAFNSLEILGMGDGIGLEEASFRVQLIEANNAPLQYRAAAATFSGAEWENWVSEVASASSSASAEDEQHTTGKSRPLSPIPALVTGRHLVIVGDQGSGKTTLLRWLALHAARSNTPDLPDLPVFISLGDYMRTGNNDLPEFIARRLGASRTFIEERLLRGQLLLLCDGLDEAGRGEQRGQERLYQQLEEFVAQYPQSLVAVSCRRAAWRRGLRGFSVAELCDLGWEDVQDFIRKWFNKTPAAGRELNRRLLQNFGLRSMTTSPLLLSLICTIFERENKLPNRRAELYSECIMLLRPRTTQTGSLRRLSISQEIDLLSHLAFYLHRHYTRELTRSEALSILRAVLPSYGMAAEEAEVMLLALTSGQGLLRHQADQVYAFAHLSLQEFFAAEALAKGGIPLINTLAPLLFDDWWREVILLLAGIGNATPLLDLIWNQRNLGSPAILLACRCIGEEPHLLDPTLSLAIMTATMQLIFEAGGNYAIKAQAINALASVKRKEAVGYLAALLPRSDIGRFLDWDLYGRVLETLVHLNDRTAIATAFACLRREELDNQQKLRLIDALAAVGNWEQVLCDLRIVLPALKGDPRAKVLLLLTQDGDRSAVGKALRVLHDPEVDDNLKARLLPSLANALEGNGPREPILTGHIYKLLQDGPRLGLGLRLKLCDFAIQRGGAARLLELIRMRPHSFEQELRRRIIIAATRFGGPEVLPRLLALLDEADSPELKRQAMTALIAITTSEQTDQLLGYLKSNATSINEYTKALALFVEELQPSRKTRATTQRFLLTPQEQAVLPPLRERSTGTLRRNSPDTALARTNSTDALHYTLEGYKTMARELSHLSLQSVEDSREPYHYVYNVGLIDAIANGPR
ncbi:MAG: NACHT domain-containing protein [Chloroflexi bacterium]|nr:NACHT domain-containing protein [Chloroflexota bacterium]